MKNYLFCLRCFLFDGAAALTVTAELSKAGAFNFIAQLCKLSSAVVYNFKNVEKIERKFRIWPTILNTEGRATFNP